MKDYNKEQVYGMQPINKTVDLQKELSPLLGKYFAEEQKKEIEKIRLKFVDTIPAIGERCVICMKGGNDVRFGHRMSQNWYQSGTWRARVDTEGLMVVTLRECH